MNEPQLSEEMEKRLEKFLTDTWGWSYEYGEWLDSESQPIGGIKDLKHFLATALEEQNKRFLSQLKERKYLISKDGMAEEYLQELINDYEDILNGKGE